MTEQQRAWQTAKLETRNVTDKLGMPVDKDIVETVSILRLLGFHTTASCGGHIRRITSGPYVIFESPKARHYAALARELNDSLNTRYKVLRRKADRLRALDLHRLSVYLDEFYQDRHLNYRAHLIIQSMPMTLNILKCHGAETALVADRITKKKIVEENRAEMSAFTEHLKVRYFNRLVTSKIHTAI
jgi:hypothetical protein